NLEDGVIRVHHASSTQATNVTTSNHAITVTFRNQGTVEVLGGMFNITRDGGTAIKTVNLPSFAIDGVTNTVSIEEGTWRIIATDGVASRLNVSTSIPGFAGTDINAYAGNITKIGADATLLLSGGL